MSKYVSYVEKVVRDRVLNKDAIAEDIEKYLESSTISGENYGLKRVSILGDGDAIVVRLLDSTGDEPDEDFESDDSWKEFLGFIKDATETDFVDVPYHYYAK